MLSLLETFCSSPLLLSNALPLSFFLLRSKDPSFASVTCFLSRFSSNTHFYLWGFLTKLSLFFFSFKEITRLLFKVFIPFYAHSSNKESFGCFTSLSTFCIVSHLDFYFLIFLNILFIYFYREGKGREGKEKERERNINVRLPLARPMLVTWPSTQACALTGNQTLDPLVHRLVLNPLSHTSQGLIFNNTRYLNPVWQYTF